MGDFRRVLIEYFFGGYDVNTIFIGRMCWFGINILLNRGGRN